MACENYRAFLYVTCKTIKLLRSATLGGDGWGGGDERKGLGFGRALFAWITLGGKILVI